MSDILLMQVASHYAGRQANKLLERLKDPGYTQKGLVEEIEQSILFAFIAGHNVGVDRAEEVREMRAETDRWFGKVPCTVKTKERGRGKKTG